MTQLPEPIAAFAPAHITGFFVICPHENPALAGSLGCGITLEAGVTTRVDVSGSDGSDGSPCPTIGSVVSRLTRRRCSVRITSDIPIGAGFGASGAGALGVALALNHALSLDLTANQLTEIAHIAEVENRTGLGDVVAQSLGGVVIRRTPGASARLDRIDTDAKDVFWVVFDKMPTKEILNDVSAVDRINPAGMESLRELLKMPTVENFMIQSRRFASGTGLMSDAVSDAKDAVEAADGMASQAIHRGSVFAVDVIGG
ncbi:MAG TPA: pantothenate kinase, partial [Methanosarcinales archaeon]|nr:pantothenate kinase [Methanosarcinales archaeon]